MDHSDLALVERCQRGDRAAFEALVKRYQDRIYNFVYRMTEDPDEAEDLTQEVFVRVYRSLPRFRGQASFQTWLYRIASNLCIDRHRHQERSPQVVRSLDAPVEGPDGEREFEVPDWQSNPESAFLSQELREQVHRALASLTEKLRVVVVMYDMQGLSYEEIAQILRCPVGTVKSRLFNARAALREALRPYVEGNEVRRHEMSSDQTAHLPVG
jgi:RNA polymerase sigma-70 factor (ECF subfamily)